MFERFTDRARRVVVLAQEEARMLNHNYIGTEHILLGLIHEGEGVAAKALESLGISLEAVRGADKKFVWAEAQIVGDTVVVSSAEVTAPAAVRYAWANNPDCNLINKAGLPASPFRTDDWADFYRRLLGYVRPYKGVFSLAIVGSAFILAAATLLCATSSGLNQFIFWRFVQGLVTPGIFAITIAYIHDEYPVWYTGRASAAYVSGTVVGGFCGRVLVGLLADGHILLEGVPGLAKTLAVKRLTWRGWRWGLCMWSVGRGWTGSE